MSDAAVLNIEPDVSAELRASVNEYQKELETAPPAVAPVAQESETPAEETPAEPTIPKEQLDALLKQHNLTEAQFREKLMEGHKYNVRIKGKDREMSLAEIKSLAVRQGVSDKKLSDLQASEEYRWGLTVAAARAGDKAAQKKLLKLTMEAAKAEDAESLGEGLDAVTDEFDEAKAVEDKAKVNEEDQYFADIKEDVDYSANLDIIKTDLKKRIPSNIWKVYWEAPATRRAMYDLVSSGRADDILGLMDKELSNLPYEKQLEIEGDATVYGRFLAAVVRTDNQKRAKATKTDASKAGNNADEEAISSVSSGRAGRNPSGGSGAPATPDFSKMSSTEFRTWKEKNLAQ